jgi:hypothetical protein
MEKKQKTLFDRLTQVLLPTLTILGFGLTSLKYPAYGLTVNLFAEVFWFYAAWKAWKEAGQVGIFITTIVITLILIFGVVNYFFL